LDGVVSSINTAIDNVTNDNSSATIQSSAASGAASSLVSLNSEINAGAITLSNNMTTDGAFQKASGVMTYSNTVTNKINQQESLTDSNGSLLILTTNNLTTNDTTTIQARTLENILTTQLILNSTQIVPSNTIGQINMQSDPTNPLISIEQFAPSAPTFSTIIDKHGILQNNSSGTGFTIQSAQDITLTSANDINLNPVGQVLINGSPLTTTNISAGANINLTGTPSIPVINVDNPIILSLPATGVSSTLSSTTTESRLTCESQTPAVAGERAIINVTADYSIPRSLLAVGWEGAGVGATFTNIVNDANPISSKSSVVFQDQTTGNVARTDITSQQGQTDTNVSVSDSTSGVTTTRTDITIVGACIDTHTATDGTMTSTIMEQVGTSGPSAGCMETHTTTDGTSTATRMEQVGISGSSFGANDSLMYAVGGTINSQTRNTFDTMARNTLQYQNTTSGITQNFFIEEVCDSSRSRIRQLHTDSSIPSINNQQVLDTTGTNVQFQQAYNNVVSTSSTIATNASGLSIACAGAGADMTLTSVGDINLNPAGQVLINGNPIVTSVIAGANIDITGTTTPTVAFQSPLTTTLALGAVNMTTGTLSGLSSITNTTGTLFQSGGVGGGPITAIYGNGSAAIYDLTTPAAVSLTPMNITTQDSSNPLNTIRTQITPTGIEVKDEVISSGEVLKAQVLNSQLFLTNTVGGQTSLGSYGAGGVSITANDNIGSVASTSFTNTTPNTFMSFSNQTSGSYSGAFGGEVNSGGTIMNAQYTDAVNRTTSHNITLQNGNASQQLTFSDPTNVNYSHTFTSTPPTGVVYQAIAQQEIGTGTEQKGGFGGSASTTQGEISCIYENTTAGAVYTGTGGFISNGGGSTATITSSNISGASSQLLRMETPTIGDAKIEHVVVGATRNLAISSQGQLNMTCASSGSFSSVSGGANVSVVNSLVVLSGANESFIASGNSTITAPAYTFTNTNATTTSCPIISTLNQGHNQTGTVTDYVYRQQHIGKNTSGTQITFGGIDCISRNAGSANEDGVLAFNCAVNGTSTKILEINGNESEINAFQTIDLNGQALKSSSGNLTISTNSSVGAGVITLASKLQSPTSNDDMIFTNNLLNTLSHSNDNGWNFVANKITTTSNVNCNNLILTNTATNLGTGTTWNIDCLGLSTGFFQATPALAGAITIASLTNTRNGGRYIVSIISVSGTASLTKPVGYYSNFGASFNLFPIADRFELEIIINYGGSVLLRMTRFSP